MAVYIIVLIFKFTCLCAGLKILKTFLKITFPRNPTVQIGKIYLDLGPACCIHLDLSPDTVMFTTVKMEPVNFPETSVGIYQYQRRRTSQEFYFHLTFSMTVNKMNIFFRDIA